MIFLNSTSQQQNDTPLIKSFHTKKVYVDSPIQQINGQKTPIYEIFELVKIIFFFNSTSQQQIDTTPYSEIIGRIVQFNKSTAKKHLYMKFLSWWKWFFSIQQVNSKMTHPYIQKF